MKFHKILVNWYLENKRELPWRKDKQPYKVWLSEIMLQQTRIAQGLPYYLSFINEFPSVFDLAHASEEKVLKLWQGLGYYSRARNLHYTANVVANELNGVFPTSYKELKSLKGVGDYTASAIASICYKEPVAVVDGNVYRVLARVFGISTPINATEGVKQFKALAQKLLDKSQPGTYNQAIMEFGALHCKPKNPLCHTCPLQHTCVAFQQDKIAMLPVKLKKTKVQTRYFNYLVVIFANERIILQQRKGKGIWKNLYEFPLIETEKEITKEAFSALPEFETMIGEHSNKLKLFNNKPIKHVLSHQKLFVKFWVIKVEGVPDSVAKKEFNIVGVNEINDFPVPVLIEKFIEAFDFSN